MGGEAATRDHARRNRMIAIAAGAITILAIVLGFAGDFLGLPWHWMRPAAELLLLAELVGLVVLERHQLFEPVSENVDAMRARVEEMHAKLESFDQHFAAAGQTTLYPSPPEVLRALAQTAREALARDQQTRQIFYFTRLSGAIPDAKNDPEFAVELREWMDAVMAFKLLPGSNPDSRARRWSLRGIATYADLASHEGFMRFLPGLIDQNPLNMEIKLAVRPRAAAQLTPELVTDNDSVFTFNDTVASFRWGVRFHGQEYRSLVARWLDDLWASIPDTHLIYSRNGLNQKALELIRKELEALETTRERQAV